MSSLKTKKCYFCKRLTEDVPILIATDTVAICSDCLIMAIEEMAKQLAEMKAKWPKK